MLSTQLVKELVFFLVKKLLVPKEIQIGLSWKIKIKRNKGKKKEEEKSRKQESDIICTVVGSYGGMDSSSPLMNSTGAIIASLN